MPDDWPAADQSTFPLRDGEVHLWRIPLDIDSADVDRLAGLLSADERERADRYRFDRHRRRFVVCRGAQREILGGYLGESASDLRFSYGERGKPSLVGDDKNLEFNVSNSDELALCAVTVGRELGVDIEQIREMRDMTGVATHFFANCEIEDLDRLENGERLAAFYAIWSRKEALLKAVGTGLAFPLPQVAVTALPDQDCRVVRFGSEPDAGSRWWLEEFIPAAGYVGAIAARGLPLRIRRSHWTPRIRQ